jgi:hypothetical protein
MAVGPRIWWTFLIDPVQGRDLLGLTGFCLMRLRWRVIDSVTIPIVR